MIRHITHVWLPALACAAAGCVKHLPPAPTPEPVVPAVQPAGPPAAGQGRLIIDVVDGPSPVQRVYMESRPVTSSRGRTTYTFHQAPKLLCAAAPCIADVPAGNILLGFPVIGNDWLDVELVHVGPDPQVYRRSLSLYEDKTGALRTFGIIGASVGAAAAITGMVLLPVGRSNDNNTLAAAGGITLGGGIALLALGIWAIRHDAPTYRPGSANHFPLTPGP